MRSVENETCVAVDSSEDDRYKDQVETVVSEFTELALAWNEKLGRENTYGHCGSKEKKRCC